MKDGVAKRGCNRHKCRLQYQSTDTGSAHEPPHGSATLQSPDSSWITSCVFRAMRAEKGVGRAMASSSAFVCRDCVPPITAAIASIVVRTTLLYGSFSVSETPEVWQCVRSSKLFGFFGAKFSCTSSAHSWRAGFGQAASARVSKSRQIQQRHRERERETERDRETDRQTD